MVAEDTWFRVNVRGESVGSDVVRFQQRFQSEAFEERIVDADLWHAPDCSSELLVTVAASGQVELWSVTTGTRLRSFWLSAPVGQRNAISIARLGQYAPRLIAVVSPTELAVADLSGRVLWRLPGAGGYDVVIDQLDLDPGLEIATSFGAIVDFDTQSIQATFGAQPAFALDVFDEDGDGEKELVIVGSDHFARLVDGATGSILRAIGAPGPGFLGSVSVYEGIAGPHLVVGSGNSHDVSVWDPNTSQLLWSAGANGGVSGLLVDDFVGDASLELLWASGFNGTATDELSLAGANGSNATWVESFFGGFLGPEWTDLDGDHVEELVVVARDSIFGARLMTLDTSGLKIDRISEPDGPQVAAPNDLRAADLDRDGRFEILVASGYQSWGLLTAYELGKDDSFRVEVESSVPASEPFNSIAAADLEGDARLELVGEARYRYLEAPEVVVLDGGTGDRLWSVELPPIALNPHTSFVEIVDLEGDGVLEIVCLLRSSVDGDHVYVVDSASRKIEHELHGNFTTLSRTLPTFPPEHRRWFWLGTDNGVAQYRLLNGSLEIGEAYNGTCQPSSILESGSLLWLAGDSLQRVRRGVGVEWTSRPYGLGGRGSGVAVLQGRALRVVGAGDSVRGFR